MIFLIVVITFFGSTGREPFSVIARAPSAEACAAKAGELTLKASGDTAVEGYSIKCVTVPTKT